MKKMITILLLFTLGSISRAQTLSENSFGVYRVQLPADEFYLISNPFNPLAPEKNRLGDFIKGDIPQATQVFTWNPTAQQYELAVWLNSIGGWFPSDPVLNRGEAFFIRATAPADITLQGEVPGTTTGQTTYPLSLGFNAHGYPYPQFTTLENSGLDAATSPGDYLYIWDNTAGNWVFSLRQAGSPAWSNSSLVVGPGVAWFVMLRSNASSYSPTVPYTWPNN